MIRARSFVLTVALPLLISTQASAHGLWTEQRRGAVEVVFGEGAEVDAYEPASVKAAWGYGADAKPVKVGIERLKDHAILTPAEGAAVTAVAFDAGLWSETTSGTWENKGRSDVKDAKQSFQAMKYSLAISQPYKQLPALDQLGLVIIPEVDPSTLKPGDALPVKVLSNGKPLAEVSLFADYRGAPSTESGKTDAQGRATVTIRNEGLNVLAAEAVIPASQNKDYDSHAYFASLTFTGVHHAE